MRDASPRGGGASGQHDADLRRENTALRERISRLEGQVAHFNQKQEIYAAAMADR